MTDSIVEADTTDILALATASIDRTRNSATNDNDGTLVAIGGGVFLTAGHVLYQHSNPGNVRTAESYTISVGEGLNSPRDVSIADADFSTSFVNFGWGTSGGADMAAVMSPDTTDLQISMIVYADPEEAQGVLTTYGFPKNGIDGYDGATMIMDQGALSAGAHQDITTGNGPMSVWISNTGMQVVSGQSGSGFFLTNDVDGDGVDETYLAGVVSLDVQYGGGFHATAVEPIGEIYTALVAEIESAGLPATDFPPRHAGVGPDHRQRPHRGNGHLPE